MQRRIAYEIVLFVALLATALAMGGALAHLLELPNKIGMTAEQYLVMQQAYAGWDRLAILLLVELASMIAAAVMSRGRVRVAIVVAIACLVAAQAVFWTFTYPANVATDNWTRLPQAWESLRARWEYSHAAGAGFQVLAMSALIVALLARARRP
jgi:hypothetical protein